MVTESLLGEQQVNYEKKPYGLVVFSAVLGLCCAGLLLHGGSNQVTEPAVNMAFQTMRPLGQRMANAESNAAKAAQVTLNRQPSSSRSNLGQTFIRGMRLAEQTGARAGCRGQLTCMRAVGLFFSTQGGNTEAAASVIGSAAGLEAKEIRDAGGPSILSGLDGIIVGAPTWHTGADEQRSGTSWDDYLDEIRALDLKGKPVAVFGLGDSSGYGDNFCDAIEELHNTFEAAGAKMLGYTPDSNYEYYADSKSVRDGKFLGLPLDADNEDDMTEGRVNDWLKQLKTEGMPDMPGA